VLKTILKHDRRFKRQLKTKEEAVAMKEWLPMHNGAKFVGGLETVHRAYCTVLAKVQFQEAFVKHILRNMAKDLPFVGLRNLGQGDQ